MIQNRSSWIQNFNNPDNENYFLDGLLFEIYFDNKGIYRIEHLKNAKHYSLEPIVNEEIICVYLDDVKTTEWKALCKTDQGYELVIGDKFKVTVN
jgi:hypothetical protein